MSMTMNGNEWWQEYDRRQHKRVARQIIRWLEDPVGGLPEDEDVWDDTERAAILSAWTDEVWARFPDAGDTLDVLEASATELANWQPQGAAARNAKMRRCQFLEQLRQAWKSSGAKKESREINSVWAGGN